MGLEIDPDRVHLFYADVDSYSSCARILREALSDGERAREERFHRREDRETFAVTRGLLRVILGFCSDREPGDLPLVGGPGGKPMIDPGSNPGDLRFSMSRSGRRALYAVVRSKELGVDVERIRPDFPCLRVSDRYFSPREAAAVRAVAEPERTTVFFTCWTLKEAFLKGTGKGFSLSPDRFEVAHEPPRLVRVEGDPDAPSRWSLRTLRPEPGYVAALAAENPPSPIRLHLLRPAAGWSRNGVPHAGEAGILSDDRRRSRRPISLHRRTS